MSDTLPKPAGFRARPAAPDSTGPATPSFATPALSVPAVPNLVPPAIQAQPASRALLRQLRTGKLPTVGSGLACDAPAGGHSAEISAEISAEAALVDNSVAQQGAAGHAEGVTTTPGSGGRWAGDPIGDQLAATDDSLADTQVGGNTVAVSAESEQPVGPKAVASSSATTAGANRPTGFGFRKTAEGTVPAPARLGASVDFPAATDESSPKAASVVPSASASASAGIRKPDASVTAPPAAANPGTASRSFAPALESERGRNEGVASIQTAKVLTRLLEAIAHRPGMVADAAVRTAALERLYRQSYQMGMAIAIGCARCNESPPDWLKAQSCLAAATLICRGWESGMSGEEVEIFNAQLGESIVELARKANALSEHIGFDGYVAADSIDTAQARMYVSVTAALGRLVQAGVDPDRAGGVVADVLKDLQAHDTHVRMKLDMRTAWMQGSLGRVTDLIVACLQSQSSVLGGDDRLTDAVKRATNLFQRVENNAKRILEPGTGPRPYEASEHFSDDSASVPRAG